MIFIEMWIQAVTYVHCIGDIIHTYLVVNWINLACWFQIVTLGYGFNELIYTNILDIWFENLFINEFAFHYKYELHFTYLYLNDNKFHR
jgi:hypothetical protein